MVHLHEVRGRAAVVGVAGVLGGTLLSAGGCNLSDLRAKIEGNREIPAEFDPFVPEAAREDLIDAELSDHSLSLRYHEGEWGALLKAFDAPITDAGYERIGTCPTSDTDEVGSVMYAKRSDGGADAIGVALQMYLKSSGHFFLRVDKSELSMILLPEGCTFTDGASSVCDNVSSTACTFD